MLSEFGIKYAMQNILDIFDSIFIRRKKLYILQIWKKIKKKLICIIM